MRWGFAEKYRHYKAQEFPKMTGVNVYEEA